FSVAGTWYLSVSRATGDCGLSVPYSFSDTVHVSQSGTSLTATIGDIPAVFQGTINYASGTWTVSAPPNCAQCVSYILSVESLSDAAVAFFGVESSILCTVV